MLGAVLATRTSLPLCNRSGIALMLLACTAEATAEDLIVPVDFPTIQEALNRADAGDRVIIEPGEYEENLGARSQVDVLGRETARVVIRPRSASLPTVSVTDVEGVLLANLTFVGGEVAVDIAAATGVTIAASVFDAVPGIAVRADAESAANIANNVFNDNNVAIERVTVAVRVTNNIFARNDETLATSDDATTSVVNVSFNCFFENRDESGGLGTSIQLGDPLFVNPDRGDFHLQYGSACIDAGSGIDVVDASVADAGAYGGGFADPRPFPPVAPSAVLQPSGNEIALTWEPNLSYLVTNPVNPGSYKVHYGLNEPGPPFAGTDAGDGTLPSPIDVGNATSFVLTALEPTVETPAAPQLLDVEPRETAAVLSWTAVDGASGYRVRYGTDAAGAGAVDVPGDVTTATITGLDNGTTYRVAVQAFAQATYYVAVTAVDNTPSRNESDFSEVATIGVGPTLEGALSNELTVIPGPTVPVPNLPDEGCFVATAAYGADWHAEVIILRDFRDRHLATTATGRALVREYYVWGRRASRLIDGHPVRQWLARAALTPFVLAALVVLTPAPAAKLGLAALGALLLTLRVRRFRVRATGASGVLRRGNVACCGALVCAFALARTGTCAADEPEPALMPRWIMEIKAGNFTPDLDSFATFYGDDDANYVAAGFARSLRPWLEVGAELQHMSETGSGLLSTEGTPGGAVTYTLVPLHLFVNFRGIREPHQMLVPYVGAGVALAYYQQEVELQPERTGRSDLGYSLRLGLQFYLNRFDPEARGGYGAGAVRQTYLFAELQQFSTEQSGQELGGRVFTLGFRFTFGKI